MIRETKTTLFPFKRYIIPRTWFDNIINNSYNNSINKIYNCQFLNSSFKYFSSNIDERKIVLIIFELMNFINKNFYVDYIIQANISIEKDYLIYINNIQVFNNNEFNEINISLHNDLSSINDSYLKYPNFQIIKSNSGSNCTSIKTININEKELISRTDQDTNSIFSNSKYSFKDNISFSSFNLDSYKKINLFPLGLKNPSIYCYMNCCLQILLSIPELNYYFLYKRYKQNINRKTLMCDDYSNFISLYQNFLNQKKNQMDLPQSIFDICNSLVPSNVMNDCEEFLFLFLKSMQEELNHNSIKNFGNFVENDIQKSWKIYRESNSSFIDSIFTGFISSTVICNICKKYSYNYEPFMDLSVPIPTDDKSIKKCLNIYFEVESIACNYRCDNCKNITSVSISIIILIL